jgi:hypothetical protein
MLGNALVAAGRQGARARVAVYAPTLEATDIYRDSAAQSPIVCKIHGDIAGRETIVITDEDYIQFVLRMSNKAPSVVCVRVNDTDPGFD